MAEETSEYSGTTVNDIGRFGEMSMNAQIAEASDISGIVECVAELPDPSEDIYNLGKTYQLIAVQPPYVMGKFYRCIHSVGTYLWRDVSEVLAYTQEADPEEDFFGLSDNTLNFAWLDGTVTTPTGETLKFIKTEIQLVYLDTGAAKTIFTEAEQDSYPNGARVIVDRYTADGINNGKIGLRVLTTYIGRIYTCALPKVS